MCFYPKKKVPHLPHSLFWKGAEFYWILLLWFMTSLFSIPLCSWFFNDLRKINLRERLCMFDKQLLMRFYPKKKVPSFISYPFLERTNFIGSFSFDLWCCFQFFFAHGKFEGKSYLWQTTSQYVFIQKIRSLIYLISFFGKEPFLLDPSPLIYYVVFNSSSLMDL